MEKIENGQVEREPNIEKEDQDEYEEEYIDKEEKDMKEDQMIDNDYYIQNANKEIKYLDIEENQLLKIPKELKEPQKPKSAAMIYLAECQKQGMHLRLCEALSNYSKLPEEEKLV